MGNYDFPNTKEDTQLRMCADVLVVTAARYSTALAETLPSGPFPGLVMLELAAHESIPEGTAPAATLAVIEVDSADPRSMERLTAFHRARPGVPVIAALPDASVALVRSLVREGVADVLALPFTADDLLDCALDAMASRSVEVAGTEPPRLAPLVAVVRSIGGCGTTAIATHLAAALAAQTGAQKGAIVVDLDLQFGSVAESLAAHGRGTIADLLDAGERLDDELLRSVVRQSDEGLAVIAAPPEIVPLETVDTDRLLRVLEQLRRQYGFVVLDLPANWTNWTLSAALAADVVLLVVEMSVASLRQAKRRLDLFSSVGIHRDHVAVVVNRYEKRLFRTISLEDVASTLSHPVLASLALDAPAVTSAQDQGRLVGSVHRKSPFAADIGKLAVQLLAGPLEGKA